MMVQVEEIVKGVCMSVDDERVRFWARKSSRKSLEILKACKVVVETFENLAENEPRKQKYGIWEKKFETKKLKENLDLGRLCNVHGKFLNLKEKGQIKSAKENA